MLGSSCDRMLTRLRIWDGVRKVQKPAREAANHNMSQPSCNFPAEFVFLEVVKLRYKISIVRHTDCKPLYLV